MVASQGYDPAMTLQLPKIEIVGGYKHDRERIEVVFQALEVVERHLLLVVRLHENALEDFYPIARQTREQLNHIQVHARKIKNDSYRKDILSYISRAQSMITSLSQHGPYVEGSGDLHARTPSQKIGSIASGGLPH